ncbi:MAG: hypothetical protein JW797_04725 [Bradymonadales bacterium]|nr:hypothetical protein [Bradymonadales bacterium]
MNTVRNIVLIGLVLAVSWLPRSSLGQEFSGTLSETSFPSVPYILEPVLPETSIRLQTHLLPLERTGDQDYILLPMRLIGSFSFSQRVIGEASLPFVVLIPGQDDARFEIGNPRIGLEAPFLMAGDRKHRWTFSFDLFIPVAQVGEGENAQEQEDAHMRLDRYALMSSALPTLSPDFGANRLPLVVGTHYRLRLNDFVGQVGVDVPFLIGFNLGGDQLFSDGEILLRYGGMVGYDLHPFYPTLEFVGVSQLSGESDAWTALMGSAGFRYAIRGFEPGVAVTFPITLSNDALETTVYVSLELVYRFH